MKMNMGAADRKLRGFVLAPLLVIIGLLVGPGGWLAVVLYLLAAVLAGTAVASFCPLYAMFGLRTCPAQRVEATDPEHVSPR